MGANFAEYDSVLAKGNKDIQFPPTILNDVNLLYSMTSEDFLISGLAVIENMFYNVCYTPIGSRVYEPEFGSNIPALIHEPLIQETATYIEIELFSAAKRWVPYVSVVFKQTYVVPYPDLYLFKTYINYVDIFTGLSRNLVLNLIR